MNVLPQAMANGRNQNGTMAGKLKGTIAAQTPTGWRIVSQSTAVATFSSTRPCMVWGIAVAASTISIARPTSARCVGQRLAHLPRDRSGQLVLVGLEHAAEAEQPARPLDRRAVAPGRQRRTRGGDGGLDVGNAGQGHPGQNLAGGRVLDVQRFGRAGGDPMASDVVVEQAGIGGGSGHDGGSFRLLQVLSRGIQASEEPGCTITLCLESWTNPDTLYSPCSR